MTESLLSWIKRRRSGEFDGVLLSLIPGESIYEFTFVPASGGIPQEYDEIRIMLGGVVAVGVSVRIFELYYHTSTDTLADCSGGDILDLFDGAEDLGIGILTGTVGVFDPMECGRRKHYYLCRIV